MIRKSLVGNQFGSLFVFRVFGRINNITKYWCSCDCGEFVVADHGNLKRPHTNSCGCKQRKHAGMWNHPAYPVWNAMVGRCYRESQDSYRLYHGKGVVVCKSWRENPVIFIKWLVDNGWKKGLQIDRKNNNGNYEPGNCRIVTPQINSNNRKDNRIIYISGIKYTIAEAARGFGIGYKKLYKRICRGWEPENAIKN